MLKCVNVLIIGEVSVNANIVSLQLRDFASLNTRHPLTSQVSWAFFSILSFYNRTPMLSSSSALLWEAAG